jgi:FMN phosphatase YigB (HAD superfamily)
MKKIIKAILIAILLTASTVIVIKYIIPPTPIERYTHAAFDEKNKPIILWDIHGVITKKDFPQIFNVVLFFEHKWKILRNLSFGLCIDYIPATFNALIHGSTGEAFLVIAHKHGNDALAELVAQVANAQKFIPGTADIVKELHSLGYTNQIGSNIGEHTFADFIRKPDMAPLFNETYFDFKHSQIVRYEYDNPETAVEKPDAAFFEVYLHKNKVPANQIVFIDDQRENIAAAQHVGMYALLFTEAAQLRKDLWLLLGM